MDTNVVQIAAATIVAAEAIDLWDAFWTLYPRHEAKKDARKAWDQLREEHRYAAVVTIADWRGVWKQQGRDESTTPLPATWLRGERWDDELPLGYKVHRTAQPLPTAHGSNPVPDPTPKAREIPAHVIAQLAALKEKARVRT